MFSLQKKICVNKQFNKNKLNFSSKNNRSTLIWIYRLNKHCYNLHYSSITLSRVPKRIPNNMLIHC